MVLILLLRQVAIIDKTSVHASSYDFGTITQEYMNRNGASVLMCVTVFRKH